MPYSLAVDQGSHSSRAIVFDDQGTRVASASEAVNVERVGNDRVEHDTKALLSSVQTVITQVIDELPIKAREQIACCGIATQRSSVLAWNTQGEALSNILSWQDTRAANFMQSLRAHEADIQQATGLPLSPYYGATKLHWLLNEAPEVEKCTPKRLRLSPMVSYLLFHLLENKPYAVDHSNAQRTQLMDLGALNWSEQLSNWFDVPIQNLPSCVPMGHNYGNLLGSGIPVTAVCGDQNAAMFGLGKLDDETALINLGSGAFILHLMPSNVPSAKQLTGIAFTNGDSVQYSREATINGAGNAITWAQEELQLDDVQQSLPDWLTSVKTPPLFINTVGGLGSPWWRQNIEPRFIYTNAETSNGARMVAVVESILFMIRANLELMQKETTLKTLRVSGGLSKLDGLCQKLANVCQLPVERSNITEATARGVAWLAAGRPEHWNNNEQSIQGFQPQNDAALNQRYTHYIQQLDQQLETEPTA